MRQLLFIFITMSIFYSTGCTGKNQHRDPANTNMAQNDSLPDYSAIPLTRNERAVIEDKATERPFTGEYNDFHEAGTYVCRRCETPLYRSKDKFNSGCGWPSFDDEIAGAVRRQIDADGQRTEIVCARCGAHIGHVFEGERLTAKDTRHCANSLSLRFIPQQHEMRTIYFAGGCFWGTEHYFKQIRGVVATEVGYANGNNNATPSYEEVCTDRTGFAEAVKVVYDPSIISIGFLTDLYFQTIDPTSLNRQGNDRGTQYRTGIYYVDQADLPQLKSAFQREEKAVGEKLAVELTPLKNFFTAEEYHQDYLDKNKNGYCHLPASLFNMARKANAK